MWTAASPDPICAAQSDPRPELTAVRARFHVQGVRAPPRLLPAFSLLCLGLAVRAVAAIGIAPLDSLQAVRAKDQVVLYAGSNLLSLTQTIVMETIRLKPENERPGSANIVELLIYPLWIKDGDSVRPAFPVLKPRLTLTHGRVRRFALVKPDGESVGSVARITPDCAYVLSLEFGHVIPKRFTVTIDMATSGIGRDTELAYMPSNDGQPLRSGPTESTYTEFRIIPDSSLQPWHVAQGERSIPRASSSTVHLDRGVDHTIRFGPNAARFDP